MQKIFDESPGGGGGCGCWCGWCLEAVVTNNKYNGNFYFNN